MKTTAETPGGATHEFRGLSDIEIEREIGRLQGEVDRLDDAYWPAAVAQREQCLDRLTALLSEQARRRI